MTRYEKLSAIVFSIISMFVLYYGVAVLKLGTIEEPGPGFFPALCSAGILVLCVLWLVTAPQAKQHEPFWKEGEWIAPLLAVVCITAYTALMEVSGYVSSTFLFLVAWQIFIVREKWVKTMIIAVTGTAIMYVLFSSLLGVPLPDGLLL